MTECYNVLYNTLRVGPKTVIFQNRLQRIAKVGCSEPDIRLISAVEANFVAAMCDALQSTLAKCGFLHPTLTRIAEDCGRVNCYISMPATAVDFGK